MIYMVVFLRTYFRAHRDVVRKELVLLDKNKDKRMNVRLSKSPGGDRNVRERDGRVASIHGHVSDVCQIHVCPTTHANQESYFPPGSRRRLHWLILNFQIVEEARETPCEKVSCFLMEGRLIFSSPRGKLASEFIS